MFFKRRGKELTGIAVDCGTSSVRAALVTRTDPAASARPAVTQIERVPFNSLGFMDAGTLHRTTMQGLRAIVRRISPNVQPREVCVGLSSPFYISKTSRVALERPHPDSPVTKAEFTKIIDDASASFMHDATRRTGGSPAVVFNTALLAAHINGYPVDHVIGMRGKKLELRIRFEGTSHHIHEDFHWIIRQAFPLASMRLVSVSTAAQYALGTVMEADAGFLLIDIGGEVTDFSLAVRGSLERTCALPLGANMFIRQSAELLKVSFTDAAFVARRYAEQTLEQATLQKIIPARELFQGALRRHIERAAGFYAKEYELPPHIICTGGGAVPWCRDIWSGAFMESLGMAKNTKVFVAVPAELQDQFAKHPFSGPSDFGLAAIALICARGGLY